MGCEHGGGVSCAGNSAKGPKQSFLGYMLYNRLWFDNDRYGLTTDKSTILGGTWSCCRPSMEPPRLLERPTLRRIPVIHTKPGIYPEPSIGCQASTLLWEYNHRAANVPYFSGSGGVTPPGGNQGTAGSFVCLSGFTACNGSPTNTWFPDLRKTENRATIAILVKF
jgi:hypothetical protein